MNLQRLKAWVLPCILIAFAVIVFQFLYDELLHIDFDKVIYQAKHLPNQQLGLSLILMALSYWALSSYDLIAVRYAKASVSYRRIVFTSFLAYAIGNNVGAALSGGAIRYRMYRLCGLSRSQIANIILFISISFVLGIALILGVTLLIEPATISAVLHLSLDPVRLLGLLLLVVVAIYCFWALNLKTSIKVKQFIIDAPNRSIVIKQFIVAFIDICLAASVLYVLLPSESTPSFFQFLPVFLIALALGLASSVPGGVGVFESVLLLTLNQINLEVLLGILIVYRIIYFLIPLCLALIALLVYETHFHRKMIMSFFSRNEV